MIVGLTGPVTSCRLQSALVLPMSQAMGTKLVFLTDSDSLLPGDSWWHDRQGSPPFHGPPGEVVGGRGSAIHVQSQVPESILNSLHAFIRTLNITLSL